jgi:hypothetical protein
MLKLSVRLLVGVVLLSSIATPGCERSERVLDVEAPGIDIEVDKSESGEIDVHVDDKPDEVAPE